MDIKVIIEIIGYVGSALVLVSMLMTSVVRLRIINLTGSVIFAGYALAIRSYPTAIMNICLAGINIYHLMRIFREQKVYELIKVDLKDGYFSHLIKRYEADIHNWFPECDLKDAEADVAFLICCEHEPAGLFIGKEKNPGEIEVILDYATPAYRDASVGRFLNGSLKREGYKSLAFRQNAEGHLPYLEKVGYKASGDGYILDLTDRA